MKEQCVVCKQKTLYNKTDHIDFRIGYVQGVGQLCLDCFGKIYVTSHNITGREKHDKKMVSQQKAQA